MKDTIPRFHLYSYCCVIVDYILNDPRVALLWL